MSDVHDIGAVREAAGEAGLVRDRLTDRLADPAAYRVGWVVAPAGSGKSRLLAHVAARFAGRSVVCEPPDPMPRSGPAFVAWIHEQLRLAAPRNAAPSNAAPSNAAPSNAAPSDIDGLIASTSDLTGPLLVVIDDAHLLEGSGAEAALASLVAKLPLSWRLVVATRMNLDVDLSRLRVSGQVVDIGPDELRFRTWEVEELFRHIYREPLLPEDVAALTRRTAGWAAYLQLFFLATSRRPTAERRLMLGSLRHRTRLVSEYLGRHVLAGLAPELRDFLVRTSVLRRPTGRLCDEFLGWEGGGEAMLAELERRQLFTVRLADDSYRYHSVLLAYLDAELVDTIGLGAARDEHRRAAALLEREGWTEEALAAYARSEDWDAVSRLLGRSLSTSLPTSLDEAWTDALPPAVLESDPLLLMSLARREIVRGALADAAATLRRAEEVAASAAVAERCRAEREQVLAWVEPDRPLGTDWLGTIRTATTRQPAAARRHAASLRGVTGRFAEACAAFLQGDLASASRLLRTVSGHPEATPLVSSVAALTNLAAITMTGRPPEVDLSRRILEETESLGVPWLARVARAALPDATETGGRDGAEEGLDDLVATCDREGDRWGAAAITVIAGMRRLATGRNGADEMLSASAESFRALGAGTLQASALAYAALASAFAGHPEQAAKQAARAREMGIALEVPGAVAVAALAAGGDVAAAQRSLEEFATWDWHHALTDTDRGAAQEAADRPAERSSWIGSSSEELPLRLRCLGAFELDVEGRRVDDTAAKPMERALLHLLAIGAGAPQHRETLVAALWPDAELDAGLHRLQVAVSALRRLVGRDGGDGSELVARVGDSYRLALPEGARVDLVDFESAADRAASSRATGDTVSERRWLEEGFIAYSGELLPSDGPAEWVIEPRRRLTVRYTEVAAGLASILIDDDPRRAAQVARAGLTADRYRDDLWKALIDAAERSGNHAEAEAARREYESLLDDLGV